MQIQIEFLGLSRLTSGVKDVSLEVQPGTTYRDLVRLLAEKYPRMIGNVIRPDLMALQEPNIFNLNARQMIQSSQLDQAPGENDRIILMSMSSGG